MKGPALGKRVGSAAVGSRSRQIRTRMPSLACASPSKRSLARQHAGLNLNATAALRGASGTSPSQQLLEVHLPPPSPRCSLLESGPGLGTRAQGPLHPGAIAATIASSRSCPHLSNDARCMSVKLSTEPRAPCATPPLRRRGAPRAGGTLPAAGRAPAPSWRVPAVGCSAPPPSPARPRVVEAAEHQHQRVAVLWRRRRKQPHPRRHAETEPGTGSAYP